MKLKDFNTIHGVVHFGNHTNRMEERVGHIDVDSRKIKAGDVFVAIKGTQQDGHVHIKSAIENGAIAIVVENTQQVPKDWNGVIVTVLDSKAALKRILDIKFGRLSEHFTSVAITGTNGKTSTSYILEHLLNSCGLDAGVIGTIDHHYKDRKWKTSLTTPSPTQFMSRLKSFLDLGAKSYVMEVSSHALEQQRIETSFDTAVFTNLSRDHLDYHESMEDYFHAKEKLFLKYLKESGSAVINMDDEYGRKIKCIDGSHLIGFGQDYGDVRFKIQSTNLRGSIFVIREGSSEHEFFVPIIGAHNIYNSVAALIVCRSLGYTFEQLKGPLRMCPNLPGRFEKVQNSVGSFAFVDYAHSPDALESALSFLRPLLDKKSTKHNISSNLSPKLVCVFGCGGDRDQGKRAEMAKVAEKYSDHVIVTSDNPRTERPLDIIQDIAQGFSAHASFSQISDRRLAIHSALAMLEQGDVLLVAGKGHETTQTIGDEVLEFSDLEVIQSYWGNDAIK